jgi:hypothetical protein
MIYYLTKIIYKINHSIKIILITLIEWMIHMTYYPIQIIKSNLEKIANILMMIFHNNHYHSNQSNLKSISSNKH